MALQRMLPHLLLALAAAGAAAGAGAGAAPSTPFLPPSWPANWAIKDSTYVFTDTAQGDARFGLTAFGWAFNKTTALPFSHGEATKIIAEAKRVKTRNPSARVLMYLNLELGLVPRFLFNFPRFSIHNLISRGAS